MMLPVTARDGHGDVHAGKLRLVAAPFTRREYIRMELSRDHPPAAVASRPGGGRHRNFQRMERPPGVAGSFAWGKCRSPQRAGISGGVILVAFESSRVNPLPAPRAVVTGKLKGAHSLCDAASDYSRDAAQGGSRQGNACSDMPHF
eukprot:CAMPEP_0184718600 /NCGR_PEP_ID=MMETSP0314-20130426/7749_1 /TAXON_ID=38298 /ORGANISM="Rhodella maculata, Strain CCMP 736" /LENGTH=145 /DNA_ID=CAMNT_0027182359 /DNA_START=570 /DNA_END=1008 /DNA_ORIENTATION=+